jgi:selenocysteine-specific elongation factor
MVAAASQVQPRDSHAIARLPIDRVFTMKGFGTVVTGTLVAGTIRREDELEVFATGLRVRVRGVQVHGQIADEAIAGQRTALNLAGASTGDLSRGMTLGPPATFEKTRRADVLFRLLASATHPLKNRARVHLHSHTMETVAEVMVVGAKQVAPGEQAFARLKLPEPALLLPGDRFILRQFSPVVTIGGGVVLDAAPIPRMAGHADFLAGLAGGNPEAILTMRIARGARNGIAVSRLVAETGWTKHFIEAQLSQPIKEGRLARIGERIIHSAAVKAAKLDIADRMEHFHNENPLVVGIAKEQLREQVGASVAVFEAVLGMLIRDKKIEVSGDIARLPGRGVVMKDEEAESKKNIESVFFAAGLNVPALHEVIAGLKIDKVRAQKIVTLLLRDKVLIKVSDELVFHHSALQELRRQIAEHKTKSSSTINVGKFKELTGVTRKYAIPLLEYLDRERVTKRAGDAREIL